MKQFNQFVNESVGPFGVEDGQAVSAHSAENMTSSASSIYNPKLLNICNRQLAADLSKNNRSLPNNSILSPEIGFERIGKILSTYAINLPAILDLGQESAEEVFEVEQFGVPYGPLPSGEYGTNREPLYLYVYYFLNDDGFYEFFAQIVDEEELNDFLETEGDEE